MPTLDLSDDTFQEAQCGDSGALTRIYSTLAPTVVGYLRARGATDPEGTMHDVFLAVLPRVGTVTGGMSGLRTLLFSVAHARMVDEHRARARRPASVSYDPQDDARTTRSAEQDAEVVLGARRVREVLAVLPPDQREVLMFRFVADLSVEQVAGVIGRSVGATKQLQRRALIALRTALASRHVSL